ncbi:MAG: 3-dehydroquinate synthase [Planctomycetaceae bacterium]
MTVAAIRVHLPGSPLVPAPGADRSYEIHCGDGLLDRVGPAVRAAGGRRAAVVSDAAVAGSHGGRVAASLEAAGVEVVRFDVPSGEPAKSVAGAERLWDAFAAAAIDRGTHVVAVGGGVVGDLAGFVAATFGRGLALWHVPTTLVAQVDSAIGGKTGVNLAGGKNLVGAFWQPMGVFSDVETLTTLPRREFVSGFAEIVKYGVIFDADLFAWLEGNAARLLDRDTAALTHAIGRSAALKAAVVERDEREVTGERAALNYGHTFAHAYEAAAGYGVLLHGEAVAIGMARAARLAARLGRIEAAFVDRQDRLLAAFGLPTSPAAAGAIPVDQLLALMARDKKAVDGRLRFVLPDRIGHVELVEVVPAAAVVEALAG